jgi:hypothetical protein
MTSDAAWLIAEKGRNCISARFTSSEPRAVLQHEFSKSFKTLPKWIASLPKRIGRSKEQYGQELGRTSEDDAPSRHEGVGSHMLQNVRCRLKRLLAHRVYADRMPAILTRHKSVACIVFGCSVHALRLLFVRGRCEGRRYTT